MGIEEQRLCVLRILQHAEDARLFSVAGAVAAAKAQARDMLAEIYN